MAKLDLPRQQVSVSTKRQHLCLLRLPAAHEGADPWQLLARCVPRADSLAGYATLLCSLRMQKGPFSAFLRHRDAPVLAACLAG